MNGHLADAALNALLDGELPPAEREGAEAHIAACLACAAELAGLRSLAGELAALPRGVAPARDLLAEIHARIDGADIVPLRPSAAVAENVRADRAPVAPRTLRSARWVLAAAAVALVAISSAVTAVLLGRPEGEPAFVAAGPPSSLVPDALNGAEARFISATGELERVLDEQRASLSPETIRILQENLAIIDAALAEARAALRSDPGNPALSEMLMATYEMKLDLLRRAATSVIT
jgi:Xaa-Pro aminopeptidase